MMVFRGPFRDDPRTRQPRTTTDRRLASIGRRLSLVVLAGLLALALSACGSDPAPEAPAPAAAANDGGPTVTIRDMAFAPATLSVKAGDTVTWTWQDGAIAHDVKGEGFRSKVIAKGTFAHRFDQPGTHKYLCTLHPNMTGVVEVSG